MFTSSRFNSTIAITLAALLAALLTTTAATQPQPAAQPTGQPAVQPAAQPAVTIPADADAAAKALIDSPRHGEWQDIALPTTDTRIHTFVVYPERPDKAPVVIVIHEIFGLSDWVRAVADRLASEGYIAVAPDLLSGMGPDGGNSDSFAADAVRSAIMNLKEDEVTRRLDAVRVHALAFPSANPAKSATIGFCWGGSSSFMYATRQSALSAAVVFYGTAPTSRDALAKINCPVLGLYAGDDARVTATLPDTISALTDLNKSFTHHTYDKSGHGFLRQQTGRDGANLAAASAAWSESIAFLKQHLQ